MHPEFNQVTTEYNSLDDYKEKEQFLQSVILAKNDILAYSNKNRLNLQNNNLLSLQNQQHHQNQLQQQHQLRPNSNNNILSDNQNIMPASRG